METAFLSELKALKERGRTLYLNVLHIALPLPQMETRGRVMIMVGEQRPFQYLSVRNGPWRHCKGETDGKVLTQVWSYLHPVVNAPEGNISDLKWACDLGAALV